jgi:hypothetical protein
MYQKTLNQAAEESNETPSTQHEQKQQPEHSDPVVDFSYGIGQHVPQHMATVQRWYGD